MLGAASKQEIDTALQLVPLPLFASYLNPPATPELEESISEALVFVREAARAKHDGR